MGKVKTILRSNKSIEQDSNVTVTYGRIIECPLRGGEKEGVRT
jgi:hypothetical protein